ncbi:MAG: potassium transporter [Gammaproteobacteria bacterium]|nr:potassium transporter [Gammaproteobacteria bacterium]
MKNSMVQHIFGRLLMLFSLTMLPPVLVALISHIAAGDGFTEFLEFRAEWVPFVEAFALTFFVGVAVYLPARYAKKDLRLRDGFLIVALFWVLLGMFGALPLYLAAQPNLTATEAVFESVSGLTTTGATIIVGLDTLPKSILYYRQQLQWLGGMGIIILAVAVLPMLGVGGMQLYRAETPGPVKDTKLTARIADTARSLWWIYLGLTAICGAAFFFAGMNFFDALSHAFSTVAIGGFSTHDASIGYFDSRRIELITIVFMFIAAINFSLHYYSVKDLRLIHFLKMSVRNRLNFRRMRKRDLPQMHLGHYGLDPEFRAFVTVLGIGIAGTLFALLYSEVYDDSLEALSAAIFQVVSIGTTTGFTTANFASWPGAVPVLLLFMSFIGGCAGSTAGGMKVIRWLLIYKQGLREVNRLVHPSAEIPVKLGARAVPYRVVDAVWGFFAVYVVLFAIMMTAMMSTGMNQVSAFSAVAACLNNLGPGLGDVSANFRSVPDAAKWVGVVAMILGRLEIFTLLVLVTPAFWRR